MYMELVLPKFRILELPIENDQEVKLFPIPV